MRHAGFSVLAILFVLVSLGGVLAVAGVAAEDIDTDATAEQTTVDVDFIGTVADETETVTVEADILDDGEPFDGEVTVTVGGEVATTALVEDGDLDAEFDPARLDLETGEAAVDIEEVEVENPATVEVVHEAFDIGAGYNLRSVPQVADLTVEGVGAVNVWNAADGSYDAVTDPAFETAANLNEGLYVAGTDADARVGYTFDTDESDLGEVELAAGWNFVSSNFDISATANQTVEEDLNLVEGDIADLDIFDAGFGPLDPEDTVEAFDGYWVFVDEGDEVVRDIEGPAYDREDREDIIGVAEGELTFGDQATASSTFTQPDPTEPGVVVEGVESTVDSAVVVTYEDGEELVVAGLDTFDADELDGEDVTIPVADAGGFPGEHVAHVIPVDDLSGEYGPGDTVSEETAGAVLDNEAATVFQGTVAFDEQSFQGSTSEVTVDTVELLGDEETLFQVDLHETDEDGAPGAFVGSSPVLSAGETETGVEVTLQDTEGEPIELTETDEYIAMIHVVDDDSEEGDQEPPGTFPVLPHASADGPVPGGVTDQGTVEIFQLTFAVDNLVAPDAVTQGDQFDVSADVTAIAPDTLEIAVVDSEFDDSQAGALVEFIEDELAAETELEPGDYAVFEVDSAALLESTGHDVYLVNEFGETSSTAFLDALDDDQAALMLDQNGDDVDGVESLVEDRNDPEEFETGGFIGNSEANILEDHPLFDGVAEEGEQVRIVDGGQVNPRAWFFEYSGDVLAEIGEETDEGAPPDPDGPAFAVDDEANEILLSTMARSTDSEISHSDYTEEANQILLNAVEHALFEQADLEVPEDGEDITETQTVEFQFDGETLRTENVTLEAGDSETVTFEAIDSDVERGTYTHGVFSPGDSAVAEIDIEEEVFFEVTEFSGPSTTFQGDEVTVSANVTNTLPPEPAEDVDVAVVDEEFGDEGAQALTDFLQDELDDDIYTVEQVFADDLLGAVDEYDLFLVNEFAGGDGPPDTAQVSQFLDDLGDDQAAMYLNIADGATYDSNAVFGVSEARDDPEEVEFVFSGTEAPVDLHIEADHPLFDGVGDPTDVLTYYEAELDGFADAHYATFDGFGGESLASVSPEGQAPDGTAIGVDDEANEILLSSQGVQEGFHTFESYTEDANEILLNAFEYARSGFLAETPIEGDATATQTVEYRIGDQVLDSEDVTLDANENEIVTFEDVPITTDVTAGDRIQGIFSEDADDTAPVAVLPQDAFLVDNLDPLDAEVTEGDEPIDVSVDVQNLGGTVGEQDITLEVIDATGDVVFDDVQSVELGPGENQTVTFEDVPAGDLPAGEYTHRAASEQDDIFGSLSVLEPVFFEVTDLDAPADITQGDEMDVSATVTNTVPPEEGIEEVDVAVVDSAFGDEDAGAMAERLADDLGEDFVVNEVFTDDLLDEVDEHDVFVINEFADVSAEDFLAALGDDQAALYLDQSDFVDDTDAVGTLADLREDIEFTDDQLGESPIEMLIDADHPIFDGVGEEGEFVDYYEDIDFAFIDEEAYSGDVIGQVVPEGEAIGGGVAVNDEENEVLFPSAGRGSGFFGDDFLYTDAENQMMENAIAYAAFEQAGLVIESVASDHPNVDGDLGTTATATQNITYEFENEGVVRTQELTLDAGESQTVTFEDIEVSVEASTYEHGVASEDDSQFADIEVLEPVNFEVSDLAAPAATGTGDEIEVSATISNTAPELGEEGSVAVADGTFDPTPLADELDERLPDAFDVEVESEVSLLANPEDTVEEHDVVVFTSMENAFDFEVENILDAAAETDTGLVFAEQFDDSASGISALSDATGDPGAVNTGFADDPTFLLDQPDHPLFAGIEDDFLVHEQNFGDHAFFEEYSGEVLADVEAGGIVEGPAVGVGEDPAHALLGTATADATFVEWDDLTDESYTLWANTVEFVADLDQPGVFDPDATGTQTVEYRLDGETLDSEEVTLEAGESTTVEFSAEIPVASGEFEHGVFTLDDNQTADLSVRNVAFADQALGEDVEDESAVLLEDVGADAGEAVAVTYTDGDEEIVAGLTAFDEDVDGEDVVVTIEDAGGFPGAHTAHVVLEPSDETGIGEPVSEETLASIATQRSAEVFDAEVSITDETVEDGTSEVTVETAALEPDAEYVVVVREDAFEGEVLGVSETQTGTVEDLTVEVDEITTGTDVAATLQFPGEPFGDVVPTLAGEEFASITDTAVVEVLAAEGANLTLADQATASSSIFGDTTAGVVVEDIQQATLEPQDVTDPADDFLVLFEGDELDPDAIVDFVPIAEVDDTHVFDLTGGEGAAVTTPATPGAASVHEWNFTDVEYGTPGEEGDEVDTITVDYPDTASFDGLTEEDITVTMTRTLAGGEDTSEISLNSAEYSGSSATFDLSGLAQTDVAGPIEIEIDGIENPDRGQYDVDVTLDGDAGEVDLTAPLSIIGGEYTAEIHALDEETGGPDPTQPRGAAETATVFDGTLEFADQTIEEPVEEGETLATIETADLLDGADDDTAFVVDVHPTDDEGELVGTEFVGSSEVLTGTNENVEILAEQVPEDGEFNEFPIEETDEYVAMIHLVDDDSEEGDETSPGEFPVLPNADAEEGFVAGGVTDDATITADIPGTITGEITLDQADPDEDVTVTVALAETDDSTTVTLAGGETSANYTLEGLDEGEYTVTATSDSENYADPDDVENVVVEDGETVEVDFAFERLTGGADGTVVASGETATDQTPAPGEGVENATLEVYAFQESADGEPTFTFEDATDETGAFELPVDTFPVGDHFVEVSAAGFAPAGLPVNIEEGENDLGEIGLDYADGGAISGEITLDVVDPEEDVPVTVELEETDDSTTVTLAGGETSANYTIEDVDVNVEDGYTVTASEETGNYAAPDDVEGVTVDVGETVEVDLGFERLTGDLDGTVTNADGDALEDVLVEVSAFGPEGPVVASDTTDAAGGYAIDDLPVGEHSVTASLDGFVGDQADVEILADETVTQDFEIVEANFEVEILDDEVSTAAGAEQSFDVAVENTGELPGEQEIELDWGGEFTDSETVALDEGESTELGLAVETAEDQPLGGYDVTVASEDDTDETTARIGPTRSLNQSLVAPGETVQVTVSGELDEGAPVNFADAWTPDADDSEIVSVSYATDFQLSSESDVVAFSDGDAEPGTVEIVYNVFISEDEGDQTYEWEPLEDGDGSAMTVDGVDLSVFGDQAFEVTTDPFFEVTALDPAEATVQEGDEPIDVEGTVENIGSETGEQDVTLEVTTAGDDVVYSDTVEGVSLDPDEGTTVTFEDVPAGDLDPDGYTHTVATDDTSLDGTLTVLPEDETDVSGSLGDATVETGETGTVGFTLDAVSASGAQTAQAIEGFDLTITYDSDVVEFVGADSDVFALESNAEAGVLRVSGYEVENPPELPVSELELSFEGVDTGTSALSFEPGESDILDADLDFAPTAFQSGSITVGEASEGSVTLDPGVRNALDAVDGDGELSLMVSLERGHGTLTPDMDAGAVVDALQSHADATQEPVVSALEGMDIEVDNQFWLGNVLSVTAPADEASIREIHGLPNVESVSLERAFQVPEPAETDVGTMLDDFGEKPHTDGLVQSNVPDLWEEFDTQGEGASIAVLDDGVNASHPDIDLAGHVAVDSEGNQDEDADPQEASGHGTHVAGTATGGDASGTAIGVAPDSDLYFGDVFVDGATESAIVGAMEWSAEQEVDVVSASLGLGCSGLDPTPGYSDAHVDAIQDLLAQEIAFVSSAGNGGEGCVSDPGNHFHSISIAASDRDEEITGFSSGGLIDKDDGQPAFNDDPWEDPPAEWPQSWVAPDVAAHGNNVISAATANIGNAVPGAEDEDYRVVSGTSMSAPHVSGAIALLRAIEPDASVEEIEEALEETGFKPADWDEDEAAFTNEDSTAEEPGVDSRYGHGIMDASAAAEQIGLAPLTEFPMGDVNQDGVRDETDRDLIHQHLVGLSLGETFNERLADVDRTRSVTVRDLALVARNTAGLAEDGQLTVDSLDAPAAVEGGDTLTVSADIENVGDLGAVQNVELRLADTESGLEDPDEATVVDTTIANLAPGDSQSVEFFVDTDGLGGGDLFHGVFTDDSSQTAEITIEQPFFEVTDLDAPAAVDSGEEVVVDATIENTGNVEDSQLVTYDPPGDVPRSDEFVRVAVVDSAAVTTAGADPEREAEPGVSDVDALQPALGEDIETEVAADLVTELEAETPDEFLFETVNPDDLPEQVDNFDVFLVNDFGDSTDFGGAYVPPAFDLTEEFYDELDETQGAIYLDAAASIDQGNAVQALALDEDRPIGMEPDDFNIAPETIPIVGDSPIEFEVTDEHPIFDGIAGEDERFTAYQPPDQDRVWFDDYAGEFVAETAVEGEPTNGSAIGVNEARNELVMALGFNDARQPVESMTNDSIALLANAIDHVAVEEDEGEDDIREISLDPGEETTQTFTADTEEFPDALFEHGVTTGDDELFADLKVDRWFLEVTGVDGPDEIAVGDDISVDATVTNVGNATDEQLIEYSLVEEVPDIAVVGGDAEAVDSPRDTDRIETIVDVIEAQVDQPVDAEAISYEALPDAVDEYDTFVVHRFGANNSDAAGDDRADAFLDELGPEQNAVYLETAGSAAGVGTPDHNYASAIERLVNVRDDPTSVSTDTVAIDGSPLVITDEHPIWTGVGVPGDNVTTNVGVDIGQDYAAAFEGYGGDVIGDDPFFDAPGVAVDDDPTAGEREVLLTNAVPYEFVELPEELTEEGQTILANAIEYAAFGDVEATLDALETAQTVELDPDETAELTFDVTVGEDAPIGAAEHFVESDDDSDNDLTSVAAAEQVNVVDLDAPFDAQQADVVTVEAELEHVGSEPTTETVEYIFDGAVENTTEVDLDPGDTETVTVEFRIPDIEPDEYTHGVELTFDQSFTPIEVLEGPPSEFLVEDFDGPAEVGQGDEYTVSATIENADEFLSDTQTVEYQFDLEDIDQPLADIEVGFVDADTVNVDELQAYLADAEYALSETTVEEFSELGAETTVEELETYLRETDLSESEREALLEDVSPAGAEGLFDRIDDELDDEVFDLTGIDPENILDNLDKDIYLVHDADVGGFSGPSEEEYETFLEEINGTEQGAVFLDTDTAFIDGVESLVEVRGDPESVETGDFGDPDQDVVLHLEEDHPIFAGIGTAGDVVPLVEVAEGFGDPGWSSPDRLWFDGYSGTDLADVGIDGEGPDGSAVGIDDERGEVLLSSSGAGSSFSQEAEFIYDEGIELIGNAVEYLTERAVFGETLSRTVELDPGESTEVTFDPTVPVEQQAAEYEHGVFSLNDSDTDTIEVFERDPDIVVTDQTLESDEVIVGQDIVTEATVTNQGEIIGERDIELEFDGVAVDSETVELEEGETTTITLSAEATTNEQPEVEVTVDGVVPETVTVDPSGTAVGSVIASGETATEETPGEGDPVANATVTVFPDDPDRTGEGIEVATTDENGTFETVVVPVGEHGIEIEEESFAPFEGTVEIEADETTDIGEVELDYAETGEISGEVALDLDLDIEVDPEDLESIDLAVVNDDDEFTEADLRAAGYSDAEIDEILEAVDPMFAPGLVDELDQRLDDEVYTVEGIQPEYAVNNTDDYDVFVVHDFGLGDTTDLMETFLEELGSQGVVYLDQNGGFSEAIGELSEVRGDPGVVEEESGDFDAEDEVEFEATADHPILEGLAAEGERFTVSNERDHAFFEEYSGDVLAEVSQVGVEGLAGPSLAVDDDRNEVLVSSIADGFPSDFEDFTDDAFQVLANAAEHAATQAAAADPDLGGTDEEIDVTVEVEETGDSTTVTATGVNATVDYTIDGVDVNVEDGYTVTASATDHAGDTVEEVTVDVGETTEEVDLTLARDTGGASGTVVDADGEPVENATLTVYSFQDDASGEAFPGLVFEDATGADGSFALPDGTLPVGDHFVVVESADLSAEQPVTIEEGENDLGEIQLAATDGRLAAAPPR